MTQPTVFNLNKIMAVPGPEGPQGPQGIPGPPGGGGATFTWQPGGAAAGNVFTDLSLASAACRAVGGLATLVFDDSFAPASPPAGSYDFGTLTTIQGSPLAGDPNNLTVVAPQDGCVFVNSPVAWRNIYLQNNTIGNSLISGSVALTVYLFDTILSNTAAPVYDVSGTVTFVAQGMSRIESNEVTRLIVNATGSTTIFLREAAVLQNNAIGAFDITFWVQSSDCDPRSLTQVVTNTATYFVENTLDSMGIRGSGSTGNRPGVNLVGTRYFDTTIGIPIWWNGGVWVNAAGVTV